MKLVRQKNQYDCGVAVLEMLTGNRQARKKLSPILHQRGSGLSLSEFRELWQLLGEVRVSVSKRGYRQPLDSQFQSLSCQPMALLIRAPEKTYGHWIVSAKSLIYDPEMAQVWSIETYPRRDWLLIRVVTAS